MTDDQSIVIEYRNERPIELLDFTNSLTAVGDEFKQFAAQNGTIEPDTKLCVREMRSGSVIAELFFWANQIPLMEDLGEHRDIAAAFMGNWQEALRGLLEMSPKARELPKGTLKNARNFVEPVAKDVGSQVNVIATDGGVVNLSLNINSQQAAAIAYNATSLLGGQIPEETRFDNEPLILWQMRDGPPGRAGDMGRIDRFSDKPKKLTFASEDAKRDILEQEEHPFSLVYFVSGRVKTAGGKVVAYHILSVDSVAPREDD